MTPTELNQLVLTPALAMLPARMDSTAARRILLAIQQQEDLQQRRRQWPNGPARGLWQFEEKGGVAGVLRCAATTDLAQQVCLARHVKPDARAVWTHLETDDVLAAAFARLLLWSDPKPLPDEIGAAWACYLRTWRPGRPHVSRWLANWNAAVEVVG